MFPGVAPHVRTSCGVRLYGLAVYMKPKIVIQHWFHIHKLPRRIWPWRYILARSVPSFCLTMFVRVMFSFSVDVLPDMQHTTDGPASSTKPNSFHSGGRQTSYLLGIHLPWLVVRCSSRGIIPRITLSQSYLTHDYLVLSSGLASCPYGVDTRMHEISIHLHVRKEWNTHSERRRMELLFC